MEDPSRRFEGEEDILTSSESSFNDVLGSIYSNMLCFLIWVALGIAMVVIGSLYLHECKAEPNIPLYLVVGGSFHLCGLALFMLQLVAVKVTFILEVFVCLFSFCWFTAGSIWVFSIFQDDSRDCNDVVYYFSFGALIFQYIFLIYISIYVCLCSCCVSFLATRVAITIDTEKSPLSPNSCEA
ncbi:transmembrane protein 272-like [Dendropsophus ebraccatus]|uniref:transmembrane protein 272-like n=1 Tax=Dendropsophus ebraccatus TaxID=150705 RepID=UPI003831C91F